MTSVTTSSPNLYRSWLTIWYAPRRTIRQIVNHDPEFAIYLITTLYAFLYSGTLRFELTSDSFSFWNLSFKLLGVAVLSRLLLYYQGGCLYWVGKALGGSAAYLAVLTALGWSVTPGLLFGFVLTVIGLFIKVRVQVSWLVLLGIYSPMLAWQMVILINGMMEVENFRAPRALHAVVLAALMTLLVGAGCAWLGYLGLNSLIQLNR